VDADPSDERGRLYGQGRNPARERAIILNQQAPVPIHRGSEHGM